MTRKTKPPTDLYSALADITRCRIIEILAAGPIPVHRLADSFPISRPAISRHLRVLKQAGLVAEVKKGRENLYAFRAKKLDKAVGWIESFSSDEPNAAGNLDIAEKPAPVAMIVVEPPPQAIVPPVAVDTSPAADPVIVRKQAKPPAPPKAAPISQMGFDF
jgi:DNA-binding transcriptional ArsR family regulator